MRHMRLCSLDRMMRRMQHVCMSSVCVMSGRLMMAGGVVTGGFFVVLRRMLVMLGRLRVMSLCGMLVVRGFLSHAFSPFEWVVVILVNGFRLPMIRSRFSLLDVKLFRIGPP
jgi:hypothetical protein